MITECDRCGRSILPKEHYKLKCTSPNPKLQDFASATVYLCEHCFTDFAYWLCKVELIKEEET